MTAASAYVPEWLRAVPEGWQTPLLRLVAKVESGHTPSRSHPEYWVPEECTIPWFTLADIWQLREGKRKYLGDTKEKVSGRGLANSSARVLPAGTVVLSRTASVGFAGIMQRPMATTQDFANFVCGRRLLPEFLLWVLRGMAPDFERIRRGSTHQTIYMPDVLQFRVPLPERAIQSAIASFLDRKTAAIDALLEKKERLIELLAEKRVALIDELLGSVAASPVKLAYVVDLLPGSAFPSEGYVDTESGVRLLRGINVSPGRVRWDETARWPTDRVSGLRKWQIQPGDVVIGLDRPWISNGLRVATVMDQDCPALLLQRVARIRCGEEILSGFLLMALNWARFRAHIEPETTGVSVPHISPGQVLSYRVPLPSIDEQQEIRREYERASKATSEVQGRVSQQLDRLREYRQALITAAVTGQLDIGAEVG